MSTYSIKVKVFERETKDGRKFKAYKVVQKDGKLVDCRFTKECKAPTTDCIMLVQKTEINKDFNREYPCYWVRAVEEFLPIEKIDGNLDEFFE